MMSSSTIAPDRPNLDQAVQRIRDVSSIPQAALRVIEVANNPSSTTQDMKAALEGDVALSTRVLRCVNSSAYALRMRITNLQQAVAHLGILQMRNLAATAGISDLFKKSQAIGSYDRPKLWRHFVSVGICARMIAMRRGMRGFEDVFLAGLLHDIGIVLEDQHLPKLFPQVIQSLAPAKSLSATERNVLGFDHCQLGEAIARKWNFPEAAVAAIGYHHNSALYTGEHLAMLQCVEVANVICSVRGTTSVGINLVQAVPAVFASLSLTRDDLTVIAADLDQEFASNQNLFTV
jgi:HD-like signal output (HDOD) protein